MWHRNPTPRNSGQHVRTLTVREREADRDDRRWFGWVRPGDVRHGELVTVTMAGARAVRQK